MSTGQASWTPPSWSSASSGCTRRSRSNRNVSSTSRPAGRSPSASATPPTSSIAFPRRRSSRSQASGYFLDLAAPARRGGARSRQRLGHGQLPGGARGGNRARHRHDRPAARQGQPPGGRIWLRQRRVPAGLHRAAARRRRQGRLRDLQRGDQPLARKPAVFAAAARALRPGGRLALADIVSPRSSPRA